MYQLLLPILTDAAGNASVTRSLPFPARLVSIRWEKGGLSTGVDFTLKANGFADAAAALGVSASTLDRTLLTAGNADVSAWYTPTANAVIDKDVNIAVSSGGNAVRGAAVLYLDPDISDPALLTSALPAGSNSIGMVDVGIIAKPTALSFGIKNVTTGGTRVPLVATSTPLVAGVIEVKARSDNTGWIYVGDVTVASSKCQRLSLSESTIIYIDDLSKIYIDAQFSGEGVTFSAS